ncbi:glycosyltransferase family 4 protein [Flavobacterium olei]|uniref:glycosyltransferase family 4 protein n=1 Tax=Flavobacterium olei TaxID=1886782 RepID=UPI00321C09AD
MSEKNLTLVFNPLWPEHISKDVFFVPYYLGKKLDYNVNILYTPSEKNKVLPNVMKGVKLVPLKLNREPQSTFTELLKTCLYIAKNAKSIDMLMFIRSCSPYYELQSFIYKKLNSKGKVYVKLDINPNVIVEEKKDSRFSFKYFIHQKIKIASLKLIDNFSCETSNSYEELKKTHVPEFQFGDRLQLLPNGFDEELLQTLCIDERNFEKKDNLIITVGRLGSPEKNTEMFLRALANVDLNTWQVCLIGTIEPVIEETIQLFFKDNPDKIDSVKFVGPIYDKKELWEYYNRAKVFVLTSDWESYALVLNEAKRFRNYIVSTEVGACTDLIEKGRYGVSIPVKDHLRLIEVLNEIVAEKRNIDVYKGYDVEDLSWQTQIKKLKL